MIKNPREKKFSFVYFRKGLAFIFNIFKNGGWVGRWAGGGARGGSEIKKNGLVSLLVRIIDQIASGQNIIIKDAIPFGSVTENKTKL